MPGQHYEEEEEGDRHGVGLGDPDGVAMHVEQFAEEAAGQVVGEARDAQTGAEGYTKSDCPSGQAIASGTDDALGDAAAYNYPGESETT